MPRLTESAIETFAISLFELLGYDTLYAPDITPYEESRPARSRNFHLLGQCLLKL